MDTVISSFIALYIGPETFMPLLSFLAAIGGVLLMFWQRIAGFFRKLFGGKRDNAAAGSDAQVVEEGGTKTE